MMSGRRRYSICTIFIFMTVIAENACEKLPWGSPCKTNKECRDKDMDEIWTFTLKNIMGHDEYSLCSDSRCKCSKAFQHLELKDNNYVCESTLALDNIFGRNDKNRKCEDGFAYTEDKCRKTVIVDYSENCKTSKSETIPLCDYDNLMRCNSTGNCGCYKDHFYDVENKTCISKDAYIKKYPEETIAGLDEFCGGISSDGVPKVCNETSLKCVSEKCKCTKYFYPTFGENKTCESKASYAKQNNLPSYKVMPGIYCDYTSECITGLTCATNNKCACPHPCKYNEMTIACDCGAVSSMEGAPRAILVGIIGGIAIVVFWMKMINKIIDKKPINAKYYDEPESPELHTNVPLTEPYRIKSSTIGSYSSPDPVSNTPYPISPIPNREPSPVPPYSVSVPSDPSAPVGFSAPTAPPPDAAQQPPPYTSNPYPTSPATVPGYSTSPAVNTVPGYPITPNSFQTTENYTDPTANVTPYSLNPPSAPTAPPPDAAQQPPPYTSNPSPYPTSPAPYTSNPTPYPTSPATAPGNSTNPAMNMGTGYPITPDSGQTTENSTDPTANATPYSFNPPSAPPAADIYKPVIY